MAYARLKERLNTYKALVNLSRLLTSETNVDKLLEIIMDKTTELLEADRSSLFIIDEEKNELWSKIAQGAEISEIRLPMGTGIAGHVALHGETLNIKDAYQDNRFYRNVDAQTGYKTKNILCVPIRNRAGRVMGVIESLNKKVPPYYFTRDDEEIISVIASLAAIALENAFSRQELINENRSLRDQLKYQGEDELVIGESPKMKAIADIIKKVAPSNANVLIRGESGTGKELVAKALHRYSRRKNAPFVKLSCAAIPETLLESELFGYEKGAFTGATASKKGSFELAHGGTLFLDEIGDISPSVQVKLLRAIQEKEIQKLGASTPTRVDVRIIAATNRNLEEMIEKGLFREDLYYRLNVISIHLPPLRERKEDIPHLVKHIIARFNIELNRRFEGIEDEAMKRLIEYEWPGNVRELENVLERAMVLGTEPLIRLRDIGELTYSKNSEDSASHHEDLPSRVRNIERQEIIRALEEAGYNISRAAKILNIKRTTLIYKMKKYGVATTRNTTQS